ncbi:acetyl-CoA carboxylase biotin carboxyl carrier protein subunit [Brevibacillus choshinensis]|uniref:Acetyl-CoA carboxylase biotin carboxyl carrier protein subunit n=1 Tax=Brevibacillus choshinensis TaxID=54911 RepID=A0ABR5NDC2_BRECH|nr:biotin/lipoyl-containing protein [Brevibacillus choshinensis]KQL49527.1 acetyl-CoA carboxylase biotin carboxyl carrier protein subunit [Brevibacillus choshinensis]
MKLHDIRELVKLVNQSSIEELEWEQGKTTVVIKKAAPILVVSDEIPAVQAGEVESGYQEAAVTAEVTTQAPPEAQAVTQTISSSSVGIFTSSVTVGQTIQSGDVVGRCSVDALQLSQDIVSSVNGEIVEIFAADGQLVDYGKALMAVKES